MAHGKSLELAAIPTRRREWVHQHTVEDVMGPKGEMFPGLANRRERRAIRGQGWWTKPATTPYVKPVADADAN